MVRSWYLLGEEVGLARAAAAGFGVVAGVLLGGGGFGGGDFGSPCRDRCGRPPHAELSVGRAKHAQHWGPGVWVHGSCPPMWRWAASARMAGKYTPPGEGATHTPDARSAARGGSTRGLSRPARPAGTTTASVSVLIRSHSDCISGMSWLSASQQQLQVGFIVAIMLSADAVKRATAMSVAGPVKLASR